MTFLELFFSILHRMLRAGRFGAAPGSALPRGRRPRRRGLAVPCLLAAFLLRNSIPAVFALELPAPPEVRPASAAVPEPASPQAPALPSTLIELDGSVSSSPDGSELSYRWRQVSGPKVELSDYAAAKPYFRTSQPGVYEFELVVTANDLDSEPHLVRLEIERENLPPVVKLPPEVWGQVGKRLAIDAGESFDPEGEKLTYRWRLLTPGLDIPRSALFNPVLAFEPLQDGVFELELIVSDGEKFSQPSVVRVNIKPRPLPPVAKVRINTLEIPTMPAQDLAAMAPPTGPQPTARIEAPAVATSGQTVMLDGRGSNSASGRRLEYLWRQRSGPFVNDFELVFDGSVERFVAPRPGDYEFELLVVDAGVESEPVVHKIRVVQEMDPPVAVVVAPSRAAPGSLVKLDATQSYDMAGSPLVYRWRQTGGPAVKNYVIDEQLGDSAPAFHPQSPGIYSFELIVSNGKQQSRPIEIDIEVGDARRPPELFIRGLEVAAAGERIVWEGGSQDAATRHLSFVWQQVDGPAPALDGTGGTRAAITPPLPGRYAFELRAMENGRVAATSRKILEVFKGSAETPRGEARGGGQALPQMSAPLPPGSIKTEKGKGRAAAQVMLGP